MKSFAPHRWNEQTATHLLARAGFGGSPFRIADVAAMGMDNAVDHLLDFPVGKDDVPPPSWVIPGVEKRDLRNRMGKGLTPEERMKRQREFRQLNRIQMAETRAWWLYRMRYDDYPLREKLTLFLHGHFATGQNKVKAAYPLYKQNQMFREHVGGNWKDLVLEVARDPAMLVYLDNARSNKRKPNENFARELMELFTLGEGEYSEEDILDVARAFTGWSLAKGKFEYEFRPKMHDAGRKNIFGRGGNFGGEDVIGMIFQKPEAAKLLAEKLARFFVADAPTDKLKLELAKSVWNSNFEMKAVLRDLFRSEAFYNKRIINQQVKSPVQWLIGMLNQLESAMPPPQISMLYLNQLGQHLFQPPNVKGWDGGFAWITSASLLSRYNFAGNLLHFNANRKLLDKMREKMGGMPMMDMDSMNSSMNELNASMKGGKKTSVPAKQNEWPYGSCEGKLVDISRILPAKVRSNNQQVTELLWKRFFPGETKAEGGARLAEMLKTLPPVSQWKDDDVLKLIHLMMSTPQYQIT